MDEITEGCHPGQFAPDFACFAAVEGGNSQLVRLSDFKGQPLIIVFYPVDFGYIAPSELISLDLLKGDRNVVAVSTGTLLNKYVWLATPPAETGLQGLQIPLIADTNLEICRKYGMIRPNSGYSFRGYVVVNSEGIVAARYMNDLPVGIGMEEAVRTYDAVNQPGATPPDWHPGDKKLLAQFYSPQLFSDDIEKLRKQKVLASKARREALAASQVSTLSTRKASTHNSKSSAPSSKTSGIGSMASRSTNQTSRSTNQTPRSTNGTSSSGRQSSTT